MTDGDVKSRLASVSNLDQCSPLIKPINLDPASPDHLR